MKIGPNLINKNCKFDQLIFRIWIKITPTPIKKLFNLKWNTKLDKNEDLSSYTKRKVQKGRNKQWKMQKWWFTDRKCNKLVTKNNENDEIKEANHIYSITGNKTKPEKVKRSIKKNISEKNEYINNIYTSKTALLSNLDFKYLAYSKI